jgi:hypothetical protein
MSSLDGDPVSYGGTNQLEPFAAQFNTIRNDYQSRLINHLNKLQANPSSTSATKMGKVLPR